MRYAMTRFRPPKGVAGADARGYAAGAQHCRWTIMLTGLCRPAPRPAGRRRAPGPLLCVVALALAACHPAPGDGRDQAAIEEVLEQTGAELPDGASDVRAHQVDGLDEASLLRFEVPEDELDAFLRSVGFSAAALGATGGCGFVDRAFGAEWWMPYEQAQWRCAEATITPTAAGDDEVAVAEIRRVLVAPVENGIVAVYFQSFAL